ncbi:MAG: hypothetical protein C5B52_15375 [Bacteroidetes bacterium]|nr:MAG: hypothetical protein C5B52_15375 [Bacteroidota bacterium]
MKKKILSLLLIVAAFIFVEGANAQSHQMASAADRATKYTDWMKSTLKLTDDQVSKVQDINLKYANKTDELMKAANSKKEKMQALKSQEEGRDAELKGVLTNDQYQTYQEKKKQMKKKMKQSMKEKKAAGA